jgi:hypothetical protein
MSNESKKQFWFGVPPAIVKDKKLCSIAALMIQYNIWCAKLNKKLPSFNKIEQELLWALKVLYTLDKKIYGTNGIDNSCALSRDLLELISNGLH